MSAIRTATLTRTTRETRITMTLQLDCNGKGGFTGSTGIGFFDHMLNSFCVHGGFCLQAEISGDLQVDCHHTIEDTGIVLGSLFAEALGNKGGINRFGQSFVPMDEALSLCAVDISGRAYLVFDASFSAPMIGEYDTQMTQEFFRALAFAAGFTLHLKNFYGVNDHHKVESLYKAAARAIAQAAAPNGGGVLSAKGVL